MLLYCIFAGKIESMKTISAMIFAAGLGTRLFPLTADKPKALVEIKGKTLLERAILKLESAGIEHIVINIHHFGEKIIEFLKQHRFSAQIEISDERNLLLDTAGGLKFAEPLLRNSEHILLYNVDIISDINLENLYNFHLKSGAAATLAVRNRNSSRHLLFDEQMTLCGWRNHKSGEEIWARNVAYTNEFAFSGIHIIRRELLSKIPDNTKLSITPFYLESAKKHLIKGFLHNENFWMDCGKIEDIQTIEYSEIF